MAMTYENAPGTKLLATNCACCRRPLLDARSAEIGMGPVCRKRHGYDEVVSEEARERGNVIINQVARAPESPENVALLAELALLGFSRLVDVLTDALAVVKVTASSADLLAVRTPYDERFVAGVRSIRGRRWDGTLKVWTVPAAERPALWAVLRRCFPGALGLGPSGLFSIPAEA